MRFLTLILLLATLQIMANDCPFGLVDDPYPGQCARYRDRDNDNICDLSQSDGPEGVSDTVHPDTVHPDTVLMNHIDEGDTAFAEPDTAVAEGMTEKTTGEATADIESRKKDDRYMIRIFLPVYILLLIVTALSKNRKIKLRLRHVNQFWDWMLLASFIPVFISSILLIMAEYSIVTPGNVGRLVTLHNICGIIFILSSVSHIYIKWQYYRNCLTKREKCEDK